MIEFNGFPARMQFTPIPNLVFSSLIAADNGYYRAKGTFAYLRTNLSEERQSAFCHL